MKMCGAVQLLHEGSAGGPSVESAERDSVAAQLSLAARDLGFRLRPERQLCRQADHDADWNRGAYLVQGLGHCGACHTPRGLALQEKALDDGSARLSLRRVAGCLVGAESARRSAHRSRRWSQADIGEFLKTGHNRDGNRVRLDDRRRQQQHALSVGRRHRRRRGLSEIAAGERGATGLCLQRRDHCGVAKRPCRRNPARPFTSTPARPATASMPKASAPICRRLPAIRRARQRSVVADQSGAERLRSAGREGRARRLSHAAIPLTALATRILPTLVSFIRNGWGNQAPAVTAAQVASLRKTTDPTSDQIVILKMR